MRLSVGHIRPYQLLHHDKMMSGSRHANIKQFVSSPWMDFGEFDKDDYLAFKALECMDCRTTDDLRMGCDLPTENKVANTPPLWDL